VKQKPQEAERKMARNREEEHPEESAAEEQPEQKQVIIEREVNLSLINEKLNYLISILKK